MDQSQPDNAFYTIHVGEEERQEQSVNFPRGGRDSMIRHILLLSLISLALASDVLEFTDDDFDSKIGDHDMILVEFFAPW